MFGADPSEAVAGLLLGVDVGSIVGFSNCSLVPVLGFVVACSFVALVLVGSVVARWRNISVAWRSLSTSVGAKGLSWWYDGCSNISIMSLIPATMRSAWVGIGSCKWYGGNQATVSVVLVLLVSQTLTL